MTIASSSGNVFQDLGLSNPEERLRKAEIARAIRMKLREWDCSPEDIARHLRVSEYELNDIEGGRLASFSTDQLASIVSLLERQCMRAAHVTAAPTRRS